MGKLNLPSWVHQVLWFVGLWAASLIVVVLLSYGLKYAIGT